MKKSLVGVPCEGKEPLNVLEIDASLEVGSDWARKEETAWNDDIPWQINKTVIQN